MNGILAIVSHPDDETFGSGGTLAIHSMMGSYTGVLCLTCNPSLRRDEINNACKELGVSNLEILNNDQVIFDKKLVNRISDELIIQKPQIVITHVPFDYHIDHRLTYSIVKESIEWAAHTTMYNNPWQVKRLLLMEINTMIPNPHVLIDISDTWGKKEAALKKYKSQLEKFPWSYYEDFTRRKASLRGSQGNCRYAEAFVTEPLAESGPFYVNKNVKSLL